jgi:hypothetical protein
LKILLGSECSILDALCNAFLALLTLLAFGVRRPFRVTALLAERLMEEMKAHMLMRTRPNKMTAT